MMIIFWIWSVEVLEGSHGAQAWEMRGLMVVPHIPWTPHLPTRKIDFWVGFLQLDPLTRSKTLPKSPTRRPAVRPGDCPQFRRFSIPKVLNSEGSQIRRFSSPKVLKSENKYDNYICALKIFIGTMRHWPLCYHLHICV